MKTIDKNMTSVRRQTNFKPRRREQEDLEINNVRTFSGMI